jgi:hypothetical protein
LLLRRLGELLQQSRRVEAELVAHIGEVDARRLYAREATPSMFAYCTEVLHRSEAEAYLRISVARASREHPVLLEMLGDGRLHLSGIAKLAPHLTRENRGAVLGRATHGSKREIEELIAELAPRGDAPTLVRKLPPLRARSPVPETQPVTALEAPALQLRPDGVATAASLAPAADAPPIVSAPAIPALSAVAAPASIEALAPSRYKIQFTASGELLQKLERLKGLMRSSIPDGDLAAIIEEAVTEKLARLEASRFARTEVPRKALAATDTSPTSRYVPAAVRRAVYLRDGGRCRYIDAQGRRCNARDRLEFHHRYPFGHGGGHDPGNLSLLCRTHNAYLAEVDYGRKAFERSAPRTLATLGPACQVLPTDLAFIP